MENDEIKPLWDIYILCDKVVEARGPDIIVVSKKENKCIIVDIPIPGDSMVHEEEFEKLGQWIKKLGIGVRMGLMHYFKELA